VDCFFCANVFANERGKGVSHLVNDEILSGQIAYQLNRPYSYILFHCAQYFGTKLPTLIIGGTISGVFVYSLVGAPMLSVGALLLGSIMIFIGMVMAFLMLFVWG
jgi:ABC-2 type transport system permease protein